MYIWSFYPFQPHLSPKNKTRPVTAEPLQSVACDSFQQDGVLHPAKFPGAFQHDPLDAFQDAIAPAVEITHGDHPAQPFIFIFFIQGGLDLRFGFDLHPFPRLEVQALFLRWRGGGSTIPDSLRLVGPPSAPQSPQAVAQTGPNPFVL